MAEKKKTENKNKNVKKTTEIAKKTSSKKQDAKKDVNNKNIKTKQIKKEDIKKEKVEDTKVPTLKEKKKESKIKKWFNSLTLEQIVICGFIITALLLIILICVATKNTKTKNGDDIVVSVKGKTITANELYTELKKQNGQNVAINLIDDYILNKEYKTTNDMKQSATNTIENYKNTYGDNYNAFLEYNGIKNEKELKEILIKNSKLTLVTENYKG